MWMEEGQRQGEDHGTPAWRAEWVLWQEGLAARPPAAGRGGRVKSELWGLVRVAWGLGSGGLGAEEGPLGALTEDSPCFCFSSTRQRACVVLRSALSLQRERGRAGSLSGLAREAAVEPLALRRRGSLFGTRARLSASAETWPRGECPVPGAAWSV